jgi:hypothetical protein
MAARFRRPGQAPPLGPKTRGGQGVRGLSPEAGVGLRVTGTPLFVSFECDSLSAEMERKRGRCVECDGDVL